MDRNVYSSIIDVLLNIISVDMVPAPLIDSTSTTTGTNTPNTTAEAMNTINNLNTTLSKLKTGSWKCLLVLTDDDLAFNQAMLGALSKETTCMHKLNLLFINCLNDYSATGSEVSIQASEALFHQSMCVGVVTNVITTITPESTYLCETWCNLINKHNTSGGQTGQTGQIPPIELLYQINHICHHIITQCVVTHQLKAVELWKAYEVEQCQMQKQLDEASSRSQTDGPMDETGTGAGTGSGTSTGDDMDLNEAEGVPVPESTVPMASVCPYETIYDNYSNVLKTCLEILSNLVVSPLLQQHSLIDINNTQKLGPEPVYMIDIGCNNIVNIIDSYNTYVNDYIQPLLFSDIGGDNGYNGNNGDKLSINIILYILSDLYTPYDRIVPYIGNILNDIDAVINIGHKSTKSILIKLKVNEKMMLLLSRVMQLYIFSGDSINEIYSFLSNTNSNNSNNTNTLATPAHTNTIVSRIVAYGSVQNKNDKGSVDFTSFLNSMKAMYTTSSNVIGSGVSCVVNYSNINKKDNSMFPLLEGLLGPFVKSVISTVSNMPLHWSDILHSDLNVICIFASIPSQSNPDASIMSTSQSLVCTNMCLKKIDAIQSKSSPPSGILTKPNELVNFKEHVVLNYASCINGIIDIHSVDDVQLLNGYKKYNIHDKLTTAMTNLQFEYNYLNGLKKTNGVQETMFDDDLVEFIDSVTINGFEFLKYKQSFM